MAVVLVVDDEPLQREILKTILDDEGYETYTASSGGEGLEVVKRLNPDVILTDLKMEDMDGIEVLKIIKKMIPELPVVMLTGHGSEQAARDGIQFGAFDYLTKPCELEDLVNKIKEAWQSSKTTT